MTYSLQSKNRWKLVHVIFRSYEIYYLIAMTCVWSGVCLYLEYPIWRSSGLDSHYNALIPPIFFGYTTILMTILVWNLSTANSSAQQYSISVKSMLNSVQSRCDLLIQLIIEYGATDMIVKMCKEFPERFRHSILHSVGINEYDYTLHQTNMSLLSLTPDGTEPYYPDQVIRTFNTHIRNLLNESRDKSKVQLVDEIRSQISMIQTIGTSQQVVESDYIYPVNAEINLFVLYALLTPLPITFWSYFSWHFGTISSFVTGIVGA